MRGKQFLCTNKVVQRTMLAPIVIFCFNRPFHLQQTVESLLNNELAKESTVFVFSDGPKVSDDLPKVTAVREFLHSIKGFKQLHIFESTTNKGLAKSVIEGVSHVLQLYDRVIVLEDDMLCAKDFLSYSNEALEVYEHRKDIFTISGYGPAIDIPEEYKDDVYLVARASSWGWSTWRDRWNKADWDVSDFLQMKKDKDLQAQLNQGGEDLWPMLVKQQKGIINSWAVRWTWTQTKNQAWGLYPIHSKIRNIGTDGSGENFSTSTTVYDSQLSTRKVHFNPTIQPDYRIASNFAALYQLSFFRKLVNWWKYTI